jgi:hypothetical protein
LGDTTTLSLSGKNKQRITIEEDEKKQINMGLPPSMLGLQLLGLYKCGQVTDAALAWALVSGVMPGYGQSLCGTSLGAGGI